MSPLQVRFQGILDRLGEPITVAGTVRMAVVSTLSAGQASVFMPYATLDGLTRPLRAFYLAWDDPTGENAVFTWNGATLVVRRAETLRHGGVPVARLLIATPV